MTQSAPKPISRERQVLDYLCSQPKGVLFNDLRLAVAPDIEVSKFAGTISTLLRRKRITRSGKVRHYVYRTAAVAPVDRRRRPVEASPAQPAAKAPPSTSKRRPIATPPASIPVSSALSISTAPGAPARGHDVEAKQPERDAIARDVAAFLARGGKIQKLRHGEHSQSGKPAAEQQAEFLKQRAGKSDIPLHRRAKRAA